MVSTISSNCGCKYASPPVKLTCRAPKGMASTRSLSSNLTGKSDCSLGKPCKQCWQCKSQRYVVIRICLLSIKDIMLIDHDQQLGSAYRVHRTSAGFRAHFRGSGPTPAKNAGQAADSASDGFVRQIPPLPVTPAVSLLPQFMKE